MNVFTFSSARAMVDSVLDVMAPVRCVMCGRHGAHLCGTCCARYARAALVCRPDSPSMPCVYALGAHDGLLRRAILGLKYQNQLQTAYELGALLGAKLPHTFEAIVPVPLHRSRHRTRGCNQAEVIARGIESVCGIAVYTDAVWRHKSTVPQSSLHVHDRECNVSEAFSTGPAIGRLQGLRALIVDDVVTTGATIAACADVLRSSGVRVLGAALALRR